MKKKRIVSRIETVIVIRSTLLHKLVSQQQSSPFTPETVSLLHVFSVHRNV
jgi:hypothetical protein